MLKIVTDGARIDEIQQAFEGKLKKLCDWGDLRDDQRSLVEEEGIGKVNF